MIYDTKYVVANDFNCQRYIASVWADLTVNKRFKS